MSERVERELAGILEEEKLKPEATRAVMAYAFDAGGVPESGALVQKCMPRMSRFAKGNAYAERRHRVIEKLQRFYERFCSLIGGYPVTRAEE